MDREEHLETELARRASQLKSKLGHLVERLSYGLIERDVPLRLALLAALSGEHLLLVGPPGVGKSLLSRRLHVAISGEASYFERLLTRFSVPEELFGPLSIRALEDDRYERLIAGYLPTASVAFVDEIFKANSAILNTLLTLLNEREFDNGRQRLRVPLICMIGASNELPEPGELDALCDRFLLRCFVGPVSDEGFEALLDLESVEVGEIEEELRLGLEELGELRRASRWVDLGEEVRALLWSLRVYLREEGVEVSDRRWRKIVSLLKVAALSDGRLHVSVWDCWLLQYCCWQQPEERDLIVGWYQQRLGTASNLEPSRFARVVVSLETTLTQESQSVTQARDRQGRLLFVDAQGHRLTERARIQKLDASGEPLYLAPPHLDDRTRSGEGYTRAQLLETFFDPVFRSYRRASDGESVHIDSYGDDPRNWMTQDSEPVMERTVYSAAHVGDRVAQVEALREELGRYVEELDAQMASARLELMAHVWIPDARANEALANLIDVRDRVLGLGTRLEALAQGFSALEQREEGA